jgi:hypothetical protein
VCNKDVKHEYTAILNHLRVKHNMTLTLYTQTYIRPMGTLPTPGLISPTPGLISPTPGLVSPTPGLVSPTPGPVTPILVVGSQTPGLVSTSPVVVNKPSLPPPLMVSKPSVDDVVKPMAEVEKLTEEPEQFYTVYQDQEQN